MTRSILLVPHCGRQSNLDSAALAAALLDEAGIQVRMLAPSVDEARILEGHPGLARFERVSHGPKATAGVDLVLVLGGDGTFLRAADLARAADLPVLGINLGHVGFLAEWESDSLELAMQNIITENYRVVERMTLDVAVRDEHGNVIGRSWALNEVSVENVNRRGVLDAMLSIDGSPVSRFGCDGVIVSTPTGSTAYAFSAGGPVMWPGLECILVVPNNAHALFARPLVVAPTSSVTVESANTTWPATCMADGCRAIYVPPGSQVEVVRGARPVKWVRLDDKTFTDRLVSKFRLPVAGWRDKPEAETKGE